MNIRDLKYLLALAKYQHFGKAALACHVSQPALSMQIQKLEEYLEVQLLERTKRKVMLTTAGEKIVNEAAIILQQIEHLKTLAKTFADPLAGNIKIGIIPTLSPYILPKIMTQLSQSLSKINFYISEQLTPNLIENLRNGELDGIIISSTIKQPGWVYYHLFTEEFLLALSVHHPLAKKKNISEQDLKTSDILLLAEGHCLRDQVLKFCKAKDTMNNFRGTSLETLRSMVASGTGVTLMPKLACYPIPGIKYLPFKHPVPARKVIMVIKKNSARKIALKAIANKIKTFMTNL